jgi:hypothetical protein
MFALHVDEMMKSGDLAPEDAGGRRKRALTLGIVFLTKYLRGWVILNKKLSGPEVELSRNLDRGDSLEMFGWDRFHKRRSFHRCLRGYCFSRHLIENAQICVTNYGGGCKQ